MTFGPLVTSRWLGEHLYDGTLRLADCRWYLGEPARGPNEYRRGHIPGAVYVSLDDDLSAPTGAGRHPLPEPEDYAAHLSSMGFGDDVIVVAYDDRGGAVASRLWWMLRSIGHPAVAVLDGGLTHWVAEGRQVSTRPGEYPAALLTVRDRPRTVDAEDLESRLGTVALIDARDGDRYRGEREPVDPIAGHIPTAVSVPMAGNLGDDERFLQPAELRARYEAAGAGGTETIVYCGSGVTACHDILAMEVAGLTPAALYPGSWSDWGSSGLPIATGDDPGTR